MHVHTLVTQFVFTFTCMPFHLMRMYVCMYVCMYVRMCVCMHTFPARNTQQPCSPVCLYICSTALARDPRCCVCACVRTYMYACMYVCMYVCMHATAPIIQI